MNKIFRFFWLILCLFLSLSGYAQMSVKDFIPLDTDLDANINFPRKDLNGKTCAIIKIFTTQNDFTFDVGMLGIVEVVYKTAEIWLYVPEKTRKIKIAHPQMGHLTNAEVDGYYWFPEGGVESGRCYKLELVTGTVRTIVEEARVQTGWLVFNSVPEGADIYLAEADGVEKHIGLTPISKKMPYGNYHYRAKKYKYHDDVGLAIIDSTRVIVTAKLKPAFGSLSVNSEPQGASVIVNGQNTGMTTPCAISEVASGNCDVRLQLADYAPSNKVVQVADGQTVEVFMTLESRFATITINSLPNAEIRVNGMAMGVTSYSGNLQEGIYDVEVSLDSHKTVTKQIEVQANIPQTYDLNPTPIYGSLDVISTPMGATITINDKNYGDTPTTIEDLLVGDYEVVLSKPGYATATRKVTIGEKQTASIEEKLQNGTNGSSERVELVQINKKDDIKKEFSRLISNIEIKPIWHSSVTDYQYQVLERLIANMVKVKGGKFTMGATKKQKSEANNDEKPTHKETVKDFYIGKYEVTQELWTTVMGDNPSYFKGDSLPVENVSWEDCQIFIRKLNLLTGLQFRLPTETEWEYAARGGKFSVDNKYSGSDTVDSVAWYDQNSGKRTHTVGAKQPNELGIYDMSGNVYEWCSDWYEKDPKFKKINRVYRGGGCSGYAWRCRVSCRGYNVPSYRQGSIGFRLVLVP